MRLKAIGIYDEKRDALRFMNASDYSDRDYDGIQLRKWKDNMPVLISHSKKTAPLMWRVSYGFSQIFFRTFEEAVEFCSSRGMEMVKGQVEK